MSKLKNLKDTKLAKPKLKYKRILLKLSGEALSGRGGFGIDIKSVSWLASEIVDSFQTGVQIAVVIGGGNIIRGEKLSKEGINKAAADYMGILGTIINALALQNAIEKKGIPTRALSAISMPEVAEPYIRRRAIRHLEKGRIIILAGGTGNPFFTTDTAASLRALEIGCNVIMKGTKVDGVYDSDPEKYPKAKKFNELTYMEILQKRLKVMDATAISLCMEDKIHILVMNLFKKNNIKRAIKGQKIGTIIK